MFLGYSMLFPGLLRVRAGRTWIRHPDGRGKFVSFSACILQLGPGRRWGWGWAKDAGLCRSLNIPHEVELNWNEDKWRRSRAISCVYRFLSPLPLADVKAELCTALAETERGRLRESASGQDCGSQEKPMHMLQTQEYRRTSCTEILRGYIKRIVMCKNPPYPHSMFPYPYSPAPRSSKATPVAAPGSRGKSKQGQKVLLSRCNEYEPVLKVDRNPYVQHISHSTNGLRDN